MVASAKCAPTYYSIGTSTAKPYRAEPETVEAGPGRGPKTLCRFGYPGAKSGPQSVPALGGLRVYIASFRLSPVK